MPDTKSIKREAALFDFFNEYEADGSPRVASFRYYKTDGTPGEKLHCSRSYETVTMAVQAPRSKESREETDKRTTINLQQNNLIRIVYSDTAGNREVRHLKIKLLIQIGIKSRISTMDKILHASITSPSSLQS